jgi:hypothetical protein
MAAPSNAEVLAHQPKPHLSQPTQDIVQPSSLFITPLKHQQVCMPDLGFGQTWW